MVKDRMIRIIKRKGGKNSRFESYDVYIVKYVKNGTSNKSVFSLKRDINTNDFTLDSSYMTKYQEFQILQILSHAEFRDSMEALKYNSKLTEFTFYIGGIDTILKDIKHMWED